MKNLITSLGLDVSALRRGQVITVPQMEQYFGFRRRDNVDQFNILRLQLAGEIDRALRRDPTHPAFDCYVKNQRGSLYLVTNRETSTVIEKELAVAARKTAVAYRKGTHVDDSELTYQEKEDLRFAVDRASRQDTAIRRARRLRERMAKIGG